MAWINPLYEEHQRRRFTRPDGQRFLRPDAHRFLKPEPVQTKSYAARVIEQRQIEEHEARAAAEQEAFEREVLELRWELKKLKLEYELRRIQHKYSPDQPRVPKGNPDGGQWASDAGKDGGGDRVQSDEIGASKKADIVRQFGTWTARQFISRYCKGSINREMPGEFENVTIADIYDIAKGGDARARTCLKLLKEPRFRK